MPESKTTAKAKAEKDETPQEEAAEVALEVTEPTPPAPPVAEAAPAVSRISRERLIREADDYAGVSPHVMAGALSEVEGEEFTVDEARERATAWLAAS